jgi:hypothetical protein
MIAYRAESALVSLAHQWMRRREDARSWVRQVLQTTANLIPDPTNKTLTVQLHPMTTPSTTKRSKKNCVLNSRAPKRLISKPIFAWSMSFRTTLIP